MVDATKELHTVKIIILHTANVAHYTIFSPAVLAGL